MQGLGGCSFNAELQDGSEWWWCLTLGMMRFAKAYDRYCSRKITQLLQNEGWKVNHKRVERVWRNEGWQLPQHRKKRKRWCHKESSITRLRPQHSIYIWLIHFVHDKLTNGRRYKMLTVIDEYTREALCVAVKQGMNANDVLDVLFDLILKRGKPRLIRSVNSPEFIAENLQTWLKKVGIVPIQIYRGSPWECGQSGTLFSRHMATTSASMARYAIKC